MSTHLEHDWYPKPIPENVSIGDRSWLYSSFAFAHYQSRKPSAVQIGCDTGLYNGTFFDLGPDGEVKIGSFCSLVGAIIATNGKVEIGDYSFIAHEVVIGDSKNAVPGGDKNLSVPIIIGQNVWIGANAMILSGAKIGDGAIVGAAAVVDFEVPPYSIVVGNPAQIKGALK